MFPHSKFIINTSLDEWQKSKEFGRRIVLFKNAKEDICNGCDRTSVSSNAFVLNGIKIFEGDSVVLRTMIRASLMAALPSIEIFFVLRANLGCVGCIHQWGCLNIV